ncbi:MAG: hypothetical protein ACI31G_00705 [Bacilli bacterium]
MLNKNLTDEELLIQIFLEDSISFNALLKRYTNYSKSIIYNYYIQNFSSGISFDYLMSQVPLSFFKAIKKYQIGNHSFYPYYLTILERDIVEFIKENSYQYDAKMFYGVFSLDEELPYSEDMCFKDIVGVFDDEMYVEIEYQEIFNLINEDNNFSEVDLVIIHHMLLNDSEAVIAKATKLPKSTVHKKIKDIRIKLSSLK